MKIYILSILVFCASAIYAEDITTTNGKKYSNVTISRAEPNGLVVMTDSGIEKIPFSILPEEFQTRYGYDSQKAAKFSAAVRAAAKQRQAEAQSFHQRRAESQALEDAAVTVSGKVLSTTSKGVLLNNATFQRPTMIDVIVSRNPLSGDPTYARQKSVKTTYSDEPIFIFGVTGFVDGDGFSEKVYPAPNYSYTSVMGASKAVRGFAISKDLSKALLESAR